MNSKGQLIISDLLFYIIILSIVFIFIIYLYGVIDDDSTQTVSDSYYNNKLDGYMSQLVKNSGSPDNWQFYSSDDIESIGLSVSNKSYIISYDKIMRLKNDDDLFRCYFDDIDFLCIYPKNNPDKIINIYGQYTQNDNKNIISKSSVVIMDYGFEIIPVVNDSVDYNCPLNHFNDNDSWSCKSFMVDLYKLDSGKYYLISSKSYEYILSNTKGQNISGQSSGLVEITDSIKSLSTSSNESITVHIEDNSSYYYIVYDNNNMSNHLMSVIDSEIYILEIGVNI